MQVNFSDFSGEAYPTVDKLRVTIMLLLRFLLLKRNYIIFNERNVLVDADQNATFSLLTYLKLAQFSYTVIGNFPDDFVPLHKIRHFDRLILATFMTIFMFLIK